MLPILDDWETYFHELHEGLGTTYERFVLNDYLKRIKETFDIKSVLECPSFGTVGISGINSLWWAANDTDVTITDDNEKRLSHIEHAWQSVSLKAKFLFHDNYSLLPFEDASFDLSWNFGALWFIADMEKFFSELTRITSKVIFIVTPNRMGLGYLIRRWASKTNSDTLHINNFQPKRIKNTMKRLNWRLTEQGLLDVPPWPDFCMNKEAILNKIGLNRIAKRFDRLCILDYYNGRNKDMAKNVLKYGFLENSPGIIKRIWAHHCYFIFVPNSSR